MSKVLSGAAILVLAFIIAIVIYYFYYSSHSSTPAIVAPAPTATPLSGRYVRLTNPTVGTSGMLNIADISVIGADGKNLASSGAVSTSSVFQNLASYNGAKLIDGDINTFWNSAAGGSPSATIDLGAVFPISTIEITNRIDCCKGRIAGSYVEILDANQNSIYKSDALKATDGTATYEENPATGFSKYVIDPAANTITTSA